MYCVNYCRAILVSSVTDATRLALSFAAQIWLRNKNENLWNQVYTVKQTGN